MAQLFGVTAMGKQQHSPQQQTSSTEGLVLYTVSNNHGKGGFSLLLQCIEEPNRPLTQL